MSEEIGVRQLRDTLSAVLRRVRGGETFVILRRGRPFARIVPLDSTEVVSRLAPHVRSGRIAWEGGKPSGAAAPPVVRGATVSSAVLQDRR